MAEGLLERTLEPEGEQKYVEAWGRAGGGGGRRNYHLLNASVRHTLGSHILSLVVRFAELCVIIPVLQIRNPMVGVVGSFLRVTKLVSFRERVDSLSSVSIYWATSYD